MPTRQRPNAKTVGDFMTGALTVPPKTSLLEVARLMVEKNVRCVAVVDGEQIKGIVTASDIMREIATDIRSTKILKENVGEIMTERVVSVSEDDILTQAIQSMTRPHTLHDLVVVHRLNVVGTLSQIDVIKWWLDTVVDKSSTNGV